MMLSVVTTRLAIPLSESFTNNQWPRNGSMVGSAPDLRIRCIQNARGDNAECQSE